MALLHNIFDWHYRNISGGSMNFLTDFLHQKVPASQKEMPAYYRRALLFCESVLVSYFLGSFLLFPIMGGPVQWLPLPFLFFFTLVMMTAGKRNSVHNFALLSLADILWCFLGVRQYGWSVGMQHLLIILLLFLFFNICIPPRWKIVICLLILSSRIGMYLFAKNNFPVYVLSDSMGTVFQTFNSLVFFLIVGGTCIVFSSSVQDTERKLRLDNETLNKEAGTDPLTGLPNRREMISLIENALKEDPDMPYSIAIADIDFFKKINDTYGHACGDMTLVELTKLFVSESKGRYKPCRWGGEEFCFFIPNTNLDDAQILMKDLNFAVERMQLEYEGHSFSITITIGVEETDFSSSLDQLLESADEKLYLGKKSGRNRVVA